MYTSRRDTPWVTCRRCSGDTLWVTGRRCSGDASARGCTGRRCSGDASARGVGEVCATRDIPLPHHGVLLGPTAERLPRHPGTTQHPASTSRPTSGSAARARCRLTVRGALLPDLPWVAVLLTILRD